MSAGIILLITGKAFYGLVNYVNFLRYMNPAEKKNNKEKSSLTARVDSFRNAFAGLTAIIVTEPNARIHIAILITVIVTGLVLNIPHTSWIAIILASGLVLASECFNTAIEYLSDAVHPELNMKIKKAKDIAAAGVLISSISSVITGLIVFVPEIIRFLQL